MNIEIATGGEHSVIKIQNELTFFLYRVGFILGLILIDKLY